MSKLYDVISRLEEIATREESEAAAEIPFQPVEATKKSPWLRIFLLSSCLILLGIIVLIVIFRWQDLLPLKERNIEEQGTSQTSPAVERPMVMDEQTRPPEMVEDRAELAGAPESVPPSPQPQIQDTIVTLHPKAIKTAPPAPNFTAVKATGSKQLETPLAHSLSTENSDNETYHQATQLPQGETVIEPKPLAIADKKQIVLQQIAPDNSFKMKQWLHQAEQRRKEEDWEGAVALYSRIWEISNQAAVANNLAASLMQLGNADKARVILQKALIDNPDDPDLLTNLELAHSMLQ